MSDLVLFDIDGTLISAGGAGRRSLAAACGDVFKNPAAGESLPLDGRTDRAICREIVRNECRKPPQKGPSVGHGFGFTSEEDGIDLLLSRYLSHLPEEVASAPLYQVLPGIAAIVERLREGAKQGTVFVGLGTGNVRQGAKIKLERSGLFTDLPIGGFGCDAEVRSEIIARGIANAEAAAGKRFERHRIFIIGDTPHDIDAGRANGVRTVAVATGSPTAEELARCKPDFIFQNFSNHHEFFSIFSR